MTADRELVEAALPGYDIGPELGRGGCGVVLEGCHRELGREVAIKELPRLIGSDEAVRARFLAEARLLASLDHVHIVPVYDFVQRDGLCLLVMERLTGGTVWDHFQTAGITMENACAIALATCAGLHYAHVRGVLHRDVKPENLLLSADSTLKVSDFGIATVLGGHGVMVTRSGEILGTPAYMAPEQAQGLALTPATDVYATGVMLYELLSGQLPYPDEEPMAVLYRHVNESPRPLLEVAPDVPEALAGAVMRALERAPEQRFATADGFGAAIVEAANEAWGDGWLAGCDFPVMVTGSMLRVRGAKGAVPPAPATPASVAAAAAPTGSRVVRPTIDIHRRGPSLVAGPAVELVPPEDAAAAADACIEANALDVGPTPTPAPAPAPVDGGTRLEAVPPPPAAGGGSRRWATVALATTIALVAVAVGLQRIASDGGADQAAVGPSTNVTRPPAPVGVVSWRAASDSLVPRQQAATTVDQGAIWVLGGLSGNSSTVKVDGYDPAIDTWKSGPDLPLALHHAMAVSYRGRLVVLGGWVPAGANLTGLASDRVFALEDGAWVELPRLNRARAGGAAAVAGDRLVVMGGQADGALVSATEEFDGTKWADVADIPTPRDHLAAASDGQVVYAVGGRSRSADRNLAVLERFDPGTGRWEKLADMPTARGGLGAAIAGGSLVAIGGESPVQVFATVEGFDLASGTWASLPPMLTPRHGLGVVAVGSSVYAIAGSLRPTHAESSAVTEVLDLA